MNNIRIELKLTAIIYIGSDVNEEGPAPDRDPDAVEAIAVMRLAHPGERVQARDIASGQFLNLAANTIPTISERIRHSLREKGF